MTTYKYNFFVLWLATLLVFLFANNLYTATMFNVPQTIIQPDSTILHCVASGDEFKHFIHTKDQFIIQQDSATGYYYITNKKNTDRNTDFNSPPRYKTENIFLAENDKKNKGNLTNIVVFVRFADDNEYDMPFSFYDSLFNSTKGSSLNGYYQAASYNQLFIKSYFYPTSIGNKVQSFQLKQPRNYYLSVSTSNPIGYKNDDEAKNRKTDMLNEILQYVSNVVPNNIKLDGNVENYLDNLTIILKGINDGWGKILWPHHNVITNGANGFFYQINDVEVNDYIILTSETINVGVICHEFFHSLGAPDLYRFNDQDNISPLYCWDLMESQYSTPQFMTAYMKHKYGKWIDEIPKIVYPGEYSLNPLTMQTNNCYAINSASSSEYFVLEYRRPEGTYESSLENILIQTDANNTTAFAGGMLIYRINKTRAGKGNSEAGNNIPDEIYCYRPNGTQTANGEPWNSAFNAKYLNDEFSATTNPSPMLFNSEVDGLKINNIYEDQNKLYFTYHNDSLTFIKWPVDGDLNASRRPTIVWDLLKTPSTYYIQISNNNTFKSLEVSASLYNDSIFYSNVLLLPNKFYYVRVGTPSKKNNGIIWSRTICFRTTDIISIYDYYNNICAGNAFDLKCDIFDSQFGQMEYNILLSNKNGDINNPISLGTVSLRTGFNSIKIYLPDSLKTGHRYVIKLQNKNNNGIFTLSNNITIYGLAQAKLYTDTATHTNDNTMKCRNSTSIIYFEPNLTAVENTYYKYSWTSKNCEIIRTNNSNNSVEIKWNKVGEAEVVLTTINQNGCTNIYTKKVTVGEIPRLNFATKNDVCANIPTSYYLPEEKYTTTIIHIDGGTYYKNHRDSITIVWDKVPIGYIKIIKTLHNNCSDSVFVPQIINYIPTMVIKGSDSIYKQTTKKYQITFTNNNPIDTNKYTFLWKINKGQITSEINSASCDIYIDTISNNNVSNDTLLLESIITNKNTLCSETFSKTIVLLESPNTIAINENTDNFCNISVTSENIIVISNNLDVYNNKIELYNILGNKIDISGSTIKTGQYANQFDIAIQNIPSGVYFLRIYSRNKLICNNAIMLNKI